ncbi:uroporphyrinogen-III C-methyltransferase [Alicyclobacillus herbarius]|uniref:uroporphyrinogen-III C-methyltransferase n=1 Tax=Alicyclobacillus herbarius TaxID=122960 RepID=UPI000413081C|nr:uroporphyrinogen-III C-methyltransferase [Alicyclobacillus herbarius]
MHAPGVGKVYLVGAGPGAAGLITVRARRLLERADAVVYDRLLSPRLLAWTRPDCRCIYVGKQASLHTLPQPEIQRLLIDLAMQGLTVVRLKGGDPFVFGRGGEEALALSAAGIDWEVVPGVTSAVSVPAYAGIPVTHRHRARGFVVETGHRGEPQRGESQCGAPRPVPGDEAAVSLAESATDASADPTLTQVVLMGVGHLAERVAHWRRQGWPEDTPVAVVSWGTRAWQQVIETTLSDVVDEVRRKGIGAPAVIVLGATVDLRAQLSWVEKLPLFGRRLLVVAETRAEATARADELEDLGAEVYEVSLQHLPAQPSTVMGDGQRKEGAEVQHGVWEAVAREVAEHPFDAIWMESAACGPALHMLGERVQGVPRLAMRRHEVWSDTSGRPIAVCENGLAVAEFLQAKGVVGGRANHVDS